MLAKRGGVKMVSEERQEELTELAKQHILDVIKNQYYTAEETFYYLNILRTVIDIVFEQLGEEE